MPTLTVNSTAIAFRRRAVIVFPALAGILCFVSMLVDPAPSANGRELIEAYSTNEGRQGLHTNLIHYGYALAAPVVFAIVGLVRGRGAWLANIAALLAIIGFSTLPGLVTLDFLGVATANVAGVDVAEAAAKELDSLPWFAALVAPAFLSAALALPVALLALWRAGLAPVWSAAVLLVTFMLMSLVEGAASFAILALGLFVVSYILWRVPTERWVTNGAAPVLE